MNVGRTSRERESLKPAVKFTKALQNDFGGSVTHSRALSHPYTIECIKIYGADTITNVFMKLRMDNVTTITLIVCTIGSFRTIFIIFHPFRMLLLPSPSSSVSSFSGRREWPFCPPTDTQTRHAGSIAHRPIEIFRTENKEHSDIHDAVECGAIRSEAPHDLR